MRCPDCNWHNPIEPDKGNGKCKECAGTGNKDRWARKLHLLCPEMRSNHSCPSCSGTGTCQSCQGKGELLGGLSAANAKP